MSRSIASGHAPSQSRSIGMLDNFCALISVVMPASTLPQIYTIWIEKNISGVSLFTWIAYTLFCVPMLIYGCVHKVKPLIILNSLWIAVGAIIIAGLISGR